MQKARTASSFMTLMFG